MAEDHAEDRVSDASICSFLLKGLDALRVGVCVFDQDDILIYHNEHFRFIFQTISDPSQCIGLSYVALLRRLIDNGEIAGRLVLDDPEAWIADRLRSRCDPTAKPVTERLTDGRWIQVKERSIPGMGVIGLWEDVTETWTQRYRLEEVAESVADGLAVWDQSDRLSLHNSGFSKLFKGTRGLELGRRFEDLLQSLVEAGMLHVEDDPEVRLDAWRYSHRRPAGRAVVRHRSGRWYLIKERRIKDGGVASVLVDITDLKSREEALVLRGKSLERTVDELEMVQSKLEQQGSDLVTLAEELALAKQEVEQADASKTQFLRTISHELRTPLNAIIGFSEVLKDEILGPLGNPRYGDYAQDIHAGGRHLLGLVNQILDLSRIAAGRYDLASIEYNVGGLIEDAIKLMSDEIEKAQLSLNRDIRGDLPSLLADGQAFVQVLVNLLSNAVKFTPAGGEIGIRACREDEFLVVSVTDTGIGIPPEKLPRLMRPFERVDNDSDRQTEGFGLGLAIAKSLLEMQGGGLEITSTLGAGTCATLRLPFRHAAEGEAKWALGR